jgi:cyanophycinase
MTLRLVLALALGASAAVAQQPAPRVGPPRVGPPRGAVVVVGGGSIGSDVYRRFIELAGGPDALIVDVPTAGGDSVYPQDWRGTRGLREAGARNVVVLHTLDRRVADGDSLAAIVARAGGVWFEGGRQWRLVDSYAGTKTERAFHDVLARGGVVGGTSAGASILASYLVRGAPSGNSIMMAPGYETGFGFLRNTAIDQHVVARQRLPDLADSIAPRHPELLGLSEDEGTAWVVRGDTAEVAGRGLAFVYGSADGNDPGKPFLTLRAGDRYDLGARRLMSRAIAGSALTEAFVDSVVAAVAPGRAAAVHVALDGRVLVGKAYNVPPAPRHMPTTTVPVFPLGRLGDPLRAVGKQALTTVGAHHTTVADDGAVASNVDELYRLSLALDRFVADTAGWRVERARGVRRLAAYGTDDGRRHAFLRVPERRATVILLTDGDDVDARTAAARIADRLLR